MATKLPADTVETPPPKQGPSEASFAESRDGSRTASASVSPSPEVNIIHVPSHSRWFSWNGIHECEVRHLPEFFESASPSKNPRVYKYYRNSIVKNFRDNPTRKITFTDARKILVGDVGSIRRVFDFLEAWSLINYQPSTAVTKPLKWEDKETKPEAGSNSNESSTPIRETSRRVCSGCKAVCTIACFACDKYDLTLCARCYVRGNYRVGVSSSDFRRVEISEETRTDWTDKDTLHLLEAIMHYGDNWRRVAQHVGGRTEKDCIAHFIKLPFGEEFLNYQYSGVSGDKDNQLEEPTNDDSGLQSIGAAEPSKRMRLTPLADASNPIMAQAAFLSALVGAEVAQASAQAAVKTLSEVYKVARIKYQSFPRNMLLQDTDKAVNGGSSSDSFERTWLQANAQLEKEDSDLEKAISVIIDVQMKNIRDKLVRFEDLDLLLEKKRQQLEQIKNVLYVDKLTLLFQRRSAPKTGEHAEEVNVNKEEKKAEADVCNGDLFNLVVEDSLEREEHRTRPFDLNQLPEEEEVESKKMTDMVDSSSEAILDRKDHSQFDLNKFPDDECDEDSNTEKE